MAGQITTERVSYKGPHGEIRAFVARPSEGRPLPAMLLCHEVFGIVDHMEDVAQRLAREGYFTLAPDMYTRDEVRPTLDKDDIDTSLDVAREPDPEGAIQKLPAERQDEVRRALQWRTGRDTSKYPEDIVASFEYLKSRPDIQPRAIGVIGYCMGGGLVGQLAASGADLAAAVIHYGPVPPLDKVPNVRCPVLAHYGGADAGITSKVPELEAAMKAAGKEFTAYVYDGAPHAFFNDTRVSYRPEAAKLAWQRNLEFLGRHLKGTAAAR